MDDSGQTRVCPHCSKPFSADLLGPDTPRAGFKCPHCGLFVPVSRADEPERGLAARRNP